MRLFEITDQERYHDLRDQLAKPGTVKISNASFSSTGPSLGTLEDLEAGKISRSNPPYRGKWFGFTYFSKFADGTPILADIDLGQGQLMRPGDHFMDEV